MEYPTKNSTLELVGVNFDLELAQTDFNMESAQEDSILESLMVDFVVGLIMIGCVFIQTDKTTSRGNEFICISNTLLQSTSGLGT